MLTLYAVLFTTWSLKDSRWGFKAKLDSLFSLVFFLVVTVSWTFALPSSPIYHCFRSKVCNVVSYGSRQHRIWEHCYLGSGNSKWGKQDAVRPFMCIDVHPPAVPVCSQSITLHVWASAHMPLYPGVFVSYFTVVGYLIPSWFSQQMNIVNDRSRPQRLQAPAHSPSGL